MLPNEEGEIWHKAFYNDISSNNIKNLDKLINEWSHNLEELDEVLSKAYGELKLKNVWLENETEIFIENQLINLRFFSDTSRHDQRVCDGDLNNTRERIELTVENIRLLKTDYSNMEKVDGKFIFLVKFIAKNIHVLKYQWKSTHDRLPWEQMEFCLVIFIASYTKKQEMNLYYRATLNKRRILHHIENFANKLEAQLKGSKYGKMVTKIIDSYPQFEELYKGNQQIREVQFLVKISDHIKNKVLMTNPEKKDGQLIIAKALKLIGEHLKSTVEFSGSDRLLQSFQENTRKVIVDLRNSVLLANSLSERIEKERTENLNFLVNVHNDIKKVGDVITNIFGELTEAALSNGKKAVDQNKLISLRGFKSYSSEQDQSSKGDNGNNTIKQIELMIQRINTFKVDCSYTEAVDEKFIFGVKSIAQDISKINRQLKSTFGRLPWEELEFCLGSFITCYTKKQEMNPFYRALLNKIKVVSHLENFAKKLEDENKENEQAVTKKSIPEFEDLYKDYQQIRDVHSLRKISTYIKLGLSTDPKEKDGLLVITRVLQVIGEHLKNTKGSPKLSDTISELLLLSLQKKARNILRELRDILSHDDNDSLSKRKEIEKKLDDNFLINLKNDMKKVGNAITDILYNNEIDMIKNILNQIVACENSDEVNEVVELFATVQFDEIGIPENFNVMEHEKLEELVNEFNDNISDKTDYEKDMFNQIYSEIKCVRGRSEKLRLGYDNRVIRLKKVIDSLDLFKHDADHNSLLIQFRANVALLNISSEIEPTRWKKISALTKIIFQIVWSRNPYNIEKLSELIFDILNITEYGTGDIKWIEKLREKLIEERSSTSSTKEGNNRQGKICKVTEEKYNEQLAVKLSELKRILSEISLNGSATEKVLFYMNDKKSQAVVEMHVLDIMAILDNYLENNLLLLDDNAPLLNGRCLRNHIAHDNALFDVILSDPSLAVILNAKKLTTEENIIESQKKIGKLIREDLSKLREKYNRDLFIISNQERMFVALEEGNLTTLEDCLKKGADVNARSINSWTTLHFAAKGQSLEVVEFIVSWAHLNLRCIRITDDFNGQDPLHIAAAYGRTSIVEYFVKRYSFDVDSLNLNNRFETPLHLAAQNGHKDTVEVLLKNKANAVTQDECHGTPADYAIMNNHTNIAEILLKIGRSFNNKTVHNFTSLHLAAYFGKLDVVNFLLEHKVQVNAKADRNLTPLHVAALNGHLKVVNALIAKGADVNAPALHNYTPLQYAIESGHEEIVNILLKHTDTVNAVKTIYGNSHLHCAAEFGHLEIVKILLENGAEVNFPNIENQSPLHFAAFIGHSEVCNALLEHGAITDPRDDNNFTPLHYAAENGHIEAAVVLIENGADLNAKNIQDITPLHFAAAEGHKNVIDFLIRKNSEVNAKDTYGRTSLLTAAMTGNKDVIDCLIKNNAEVNTATNVGMTPLHEAALRSHGDAVSLLVRNNADINARTNIGLTPLDAAVLGGNKEVVKILIENNVRDSNSITANMKLNASKFAVHCRHVDIMKILLENEDIVNMSLDIVENNHDTVENNGTLLHLAVNEGHKEMVNVLIKNGADPNAIVFSFEMPYTPLYFAAQNGDEEMIAILIAGGANVNLKLAVPPLNAAAIMGHSTIVNVLLQNKADINIKFNNIAAVELAVIYGHLQVVKMLLENKNLLDKEGKGIDGHTLLHIASGQGNLEMVEYLVDEGFDINARNVFGAKSMHLAAEDGHQDIVDYFLRTMKISIDDPGGSNKTLLHYAARNGHLEVVNYLIVKGADANAKDDNGLTALYLAVQFGYKDVIQVLLKNGAIYNAVDQLGRKLLEITKDINT